MKTRVMSLTDARLKFGNLGLLARRAPIEVTRDGQAEFVVLSPEHYRQLLGAVEAPAPRTAAPGPGAPAASDTPQKDIPAFLKRVRAAKASGGGS